MACRKCLKKSIRCLASTSALVIEKKKLKLAVILPR